MKVTTHATKAPHEIIDASSDFFHLNMAQLYHAMCDAESYRTGDNGVERPYERTLY